MSIFCELFLKAFFNFKKRERVWKTFILSGKKSKSKLFSLQSSFLPFIGSLQKNLFALNQIYFCEIASKKSQVLRHRYLMAKICRNSQPAASRPFGPETIRPKGKIYFARKSFVNREEKWIVSFGNVSKNSFLSGTDKQTPSWRKHQSSCLVTGLMHNCASSLSSKLSCHC